MALPRLPDAIINEGASKASIQATAAAIGATVPVIYGRVRVGGLVFALGLKDANLVIGAAWCCGPVQAIESITINDEAVPSTVTVTNYLGSATQTTDPTLAGAIAGYADAMIASTTELVPICYSVFEIPPKTVSGWPRLNAIIQGRLVYDPRTVTTAYSRNPALALGDWMASRGYGQGLGATGIDWTSVATVANACDEALADSSKRREIDLAISNALPAPQWSDILRTYAGCFIAHNGSQSILIPDRPVTLANCRQLDSDDMVGGSFTLKRASTLQRPTVVTVSYTDNSEIPWRTPSVSAVDGAAFGAWREETVSLEGITRRLQAYREAVERVNAAKYADLAATWDTFDEGAQDTIGDVVRVTHPLGLTDVAFRITDVQSRSPGRWTVTANNYNELVYSDAINPPWSGDYTTLPGLDDIPVVTGITCASGSDHLLLSSDGTLISRLRVTWATLTYPFAAIVEVEFKRAADTAWQRTEGIEGAYCSPVQDAATYDVRVRIRNTLGLVGEWAVTSHTVIGKTEAPPVPRNFGVSTYADGTRIFSWQPPATVPLDLSGYRLRYKLGTGQTWDNMAPLHSGDLTTSPYETNALSAGVYTFALKSADTSGNLSDPVYIEGTLPDPRLSGVLEIYDPMAEGWPGTITTGWADPITGWLVATDTKTWADFATDAVTWADWTDYARATNDLVYQYSDIDLGVVATFTPLISVTCPEGTPTIEVATSSDGSTWGSWQAAAQPVTTRHLRVRVSVSATAGDQIRLESMSIVLDAAPITEDIEDLDISTLTGSYRLATGDVRLPINETYAVIRSVSLTLQNTGGGWTWELIDKDTTTGPRIKVYNASGTLADATIDAFVRGL